MSDERSSIAICIATWRRPQLLRELLESLEQLTVPDGYRLEIRIVDNDAAASARATVDLFAQLAPHYAVEPVRNIARARNRALDVGATDWVAFIDDDEIARPDWLCALLERAHATGADAVFGPVAARMPDGAPAWMAHARLFDKPVADTERIPWRAARTSNTLVRGHWFATGMRFDPAFARSGAEDTELFSRMAELGARLVPAPAAVIDETIHPEQCRLAWFARRHYRGGANFERLAEDGGARALGRLVKRLACGTGLAITGLPGCLRGRPARTWHGVLQLARAAGGIAGWLSPRAVTRVKGYHSSGTREVRA